MGIKLDIACGRHKDLGWVGMDIQALKDVDIVHDLNLHPWPVESGSVEAAKAWHIVEHIPPVAVTEKGTRRPFIEFMDECWRVLQTGARIDIETPHGASDSFLHDPTHCNPVDELTFEHFCPEYRRYLTYSPRPWRMVSLRWTRDGNVNVVLEKITE
jgi:predicted SAM-dependent methyltransferase